MCFWSSGRVGNFLLVIFTVFKKQKRKEKRKRDFAATRLATILATRWTGNKLFLRVPCLYLCIIHVVFKVV